MVMGPATTGDPDTLLSWGASVGPETSNGEWWRLLTALFASWGAMHLLADAAGLGAAGFLLERLTGPGAFAAIFVGAGLVSGAAGLAAHPVTVQAGASGAIAGLYGLLATLAVWGWIRPSPATIPLASLKRIWPGVALFVLYAGLAEGLWSEALRLGLLSGICGGLVMASGLGLHTPRPRQVATVAGLAVLVVAVLAVPVRGMADVAAEVRFVADVEHRTSAAYGDAVERFRRGRMDAAGLRAVIEESVLPDIQNAQARVDAIDRVPAAQQALVDGATAYLRLREQSWRVRVEGLGQGDFTTFAESDRLAQESRVALDAITEAVGIVD
jgi:rhomboid protease GluP